MFAGIYRDKFTEAGFAASVVADGRTGLGAIQDSRPDLVVLDLMLPHLSGFELIEAIRSHAESAQTPVIVVTNLDQHDEEKRAMTLGANAYFVKAHATFAEVLAKAKELLG